MKLRTRITLSMFALVLFSLLVIGVVTVVYFQNQNRDYHKERLQRKERAIKTEMQYFSKEVEMQEDQDVVIKEFEEELLRLASVHQLEINVFNTEGQLLVAARPDSIHSEYMAKTVPIHVLEILNEANRMVIPEEEGDRKYLSDYTNLYNSDDQRIAILNIPYLQDPTINQQELEGFLGSIGAVYLFILIAGIGLSLLLARSITRSLTALSDRLQRVNLDETNEHFPSKQTDDEVAKLVDAYNAMLDKLDESRKELARRERESAWREMAKQVAHEIKNPLTPMKLSVQHLQATSAYDDPVWREKFTKTMNSLIQQIESLSNIATEFSYFAKMPKPSIKRMSLNQAVKSAELLFTDVPFNLRVSISDQELFIEADEEQIARVLNNLLKNAKHAVAEQSDPSVTIELIQDEHTAQLTIKDNGVGIPEELKRKIFTPNFTTKTSGTGLGLAISKQIIESYGGNISFESTAGSGTTFTIRIPTIG